MILKALIPLLDSDLVAVLGLVWRLGKRVLSRKAHEGMYEVLAYEARLELKDSKGKTAVYSKRQRVRFLQNNIIAYQDVAWGDGDIFADYKCSPGVAVDCYREGHRYNILISLRETKQRGDETTFHIERTIHNGFSQKVEAFQTEIDHWTHQLALSVIFPESHQPTKVDLIEQNSNRTTPLGVGHRQVLSDGRHEFSWKTKSPRLYEAFILRWEW